MITPEGDAKLIDFGLAKNLHELGLGITSSGETLGTMGYMAPEQVRTARDVDIRTDMFGLGATLYHALAGRPPFIAASEAELVERLDQGPALDWLVGVPLNVVAVIVKAMQKRPEDRFQAPGEMMAALHKVVTELTGIRDEDVRSAPEFKALAYEVLEFLVPGEHTSVFVQVGVSGFDMG